MKIVNQAFKHLILVGLIVSTSLSESFGQVITRVLSPEDKIENYIPWYNPDDEVPIVNAPLVDVEAVLQEDEQTGRKMPRISIKKEVSYMIEDGRLIDKGNYSLWSMTLRSENAKSMSVRFEITNLPANAIMYLFNEETGFVVGPIKNGNFRNGVFQSDYVNGDRISIHAFVPNSESSEDLSIYISSYNHGILSFDSDFESSGECQINASCEAGMDCQIGSVCKIIIGESACSGALVNNDCCDLTPYILTADHCFTATGLNPIDWSFRFHYESPSCNPSEEPHPSQWVTYSGANINARWVNTDFLLLELNESINQERNLSFSGWDRNDINSGSTTGVHHPSGDVKKVSYDDDPNVVNGNFHSVIFDQGIVEPASSGSPLYDDNNRIIGQLCCGSRRGCEDQNASFNYGRLDESWDGNGTPNSRLRDWLGASTNPNTMDCMEHPFIEGPDVLCEEPEIFALVNNNMPCIKDVQWEVNASNLVTSPTSGIGNTATLSALPNVKGFATITYTLTSNGCDPAEVEKEFWVGAPQALTSFPDPTICLGELDEQIIIPESYGASSYHLESLSPHVFILTNSPTPYVPIGIIGTQVGIFQLQMTVTNDCGSSSAIIFVEVERCRGDEGGFRSTNSSPKSGERDYDVSIYPNPASDFIEVAFSGYSNGARIVANLISTSGKVVRSIEEGSRYFKVDIADLPSGLYTLQLNVNGRMFHEKIVKL